MGQDYCKGSLHRVDLDPNPLIQLAAWVEEARGKNIPEPSAATLGTASSTGVPSTRTILIKGVDEAGLTFYTHYESRKGREIESNPFASLTFYWRELERQAIVDGRVSYLSPDESARYFHTRPRASQIGAHASHQGNPVGSRQELEEAFAAVETEYAGGEIPLPPRWGGYLIVPERIEFWQGRLGRLHDRINYRRDDGGWHRERLSP